MTDAVVPEAQLALSEAPRTSVDASVFQGHPDTARGLQQLGAGLDDLATPLATIQGQEDAANAVTRAPDGSISIIQHPAAPILGKPGQAYQASLEAGLAAGGRSAIELQLAQMATKYQNDAAGFRAASGAYIDTWKQNNPGTFGLAMAQYAQSIATQHDVNLVAQQQRSDFNQTSNVLDGRLSQLEKQMDGLAGQGGMQSPQFIALSKERDAILEQKVSNPAFGYNSDQRDIDNANLETRLSVAALTGKARADAQRTGNTAAALQEAAATLKTLPIPEDKQIAYLGEITRHLSALSAVGAQQRQQLSDQADELSNRAMLHPNLVQPEELDDMSMQLERVKMFGKSAEVQNAKVYNQLIAPEIIGGTVADAVTGLHQVQAMAAGRTMPSPLEAPIASERTALQFFQAQGYTQAQAAGIVGNLVRESGLRTGALNKGDGADGSDSIGIGQWNGTRALSLKAFAAAAGKPVTDFGTQLAFVQHELQTTEGAAAARLRAARTPEEAATAFALGYERPAGFQTGNMATVAGGQDRIDQAQRLASSGGSTDGIPAGGSIDGTPGQFAMRFSLAVKQAQAAYNTRAEKLWGGVESALSNQQAPTAQEVSDIRTMLPDVTDPNLRTKIVQGLTAFAATDQVKTLPVAQQQQLAETLTLAGQAGQLGNVERQTAGAIVKQVATQARMAHDDPVSYGIVKTPIEVAKANNLPELSSLDPSNPDAFTAGLKARQTWKNIARADPAASNLPLQKTDIAQMTAAAPSWTGDQARVALGAIGGTFTGPEQDSLMANKDFRTMVAGLAHSGDPAKMNAAFSFLDARYRANPMQFDASDPQAVKELHTWQSFISFLPPDEAAKRMLQAGDPSEIKAREALGKQAEENLAGLDPRGVVRSVYGRQVPLVGTTIPFTSPGDIASDRPAVAMNSMLYDYREAYVDRFKADGDDAAARDYAAQKLRDKYSVSDINGGRVMAYAPDSETADGTGALYPKINGSFDWLHNQLRVDIQQTPFFHDLRASGQLAEAARVARGQDYYLLSDEKTQADLAGKRPPSYQVIAIGNDGRMHLIEASPGRAWRWRGDPKLALENANAAFMAQRAQDLAPADVMPDNVD